ncbi:thioredoxin [Corynebacterium pseudokroppenstedtii]|uniref:thioredoxin n=1 Tax=Corynebacterium pseudokroppenstedtii TaxID=2804917 RepID=UPI003078D255
MTSPVNVTTDSFRSTVVDSDKPVLVDFWATWCGPCRKMNPVLEEIADEYDGKAVVAKVNVDENAPLASMFQVMSIPTMVLFKDGKKVEEIHGAHPKTHITTALEKLL